MSDERSSRELLRGFVRRRILAGAVGVYGLGILVLRRFDGLKLPVAGSSPIEALLFVPAMVIGMLLAQRFFGADR